MILEARLSVKELGRRTGNALRYAPYAGGGT
jgi:hypothetical protein